jgi:hypothetical protein
MTGRAFSDIVYRPGYYSAAEFAWSKAMHAASIYPAKVEDLMARDFRISALGALAQPESGKRKYANGKGEGLLSRSIQV